MIKLRYIVVISIIFILLFLIIPFVNPTSVLREPIDTTCTDCIQAYEDSSTNDPPPPANTLPPGGQTEHTQTEYDLIKTSNDNSDTSSVTDNLEGYVLFNSSVPANSQILFLNWTWEGEWDDGSSPPNNNGNISFYIWNFTGSSWYECVSNSGDTAGAEIIKSCSINRTSGVSDFYSGGNSYFLVYGEDPNDVDSLSNSIITDYIKLDVTYLNVTLSSPLNGTSSLQSSQDFVCNTTGYSLENSTLYIWNSTGSLNVTNSTNISGLSNSSTLSNTFSADGTYLWNCLVSDSGVTSFAQNNFTLIIDAIPPQVTINKPTAFQNLTGSVQFNITINEAGACRYSLNSGVNNVSMTNNGNTDFTNTNSSIADGTYIMRAYCNDTSGNQNNTVNRTFTMDSTAPSLNIVHPAQSQELNYNTSINLNFTISDSGVGLGSCWFNLDNGANTTITNCLNTTFNTSDGSHTVYLFSNDTINNRASDSNTFTISLSAPAITLNYPPNNTFFSSRNNIYLNYTAIDSNGISTCQVWHDLNGSFSLNLTNTGVTTGQMNFTIINASSDDTYKWNVWCNDTTNNGRFSTNNFTFIVDTLSPSVSVGDITTTQGSQTFTVNHTEIDSNLNLCWYSIYNSSGGIDPATTSNTSITCNQDFSETASAFGTFNVTVYANDTSGNENSTTKQFSTVAVSGGTTGGGGGGGSGIPVIALQESNTSNLYSDLERAIAYASINNFCSVKIKDEPLAVADFSDTCTLTINDLIPIGKILKDFGLEVPESDLREFIEVFKDRRFVQVYVDKLDVEKYDLFSRILGGGLTTWLLSNLDKYFTIFEPSGNSTTIFWTATSNKDLKSCEVISNTENLKCLITSNSTLRIDYFIKDSSFITKTFSGNLLITNSENEQKRTSVNMRVLNYGNPSSIALGIGVVSLISVLIFVRARKKRRKISQQVRELISLK